MSRKSGFTKEDDFQAHLKKDWRTAHKIWENIKGAVGPPGKKGAVGLEGVTGPQGPAGDTGPQGETGPTGPTGVEGAQGVIGESGPVGPTGPTGVEGAQGVIGESGPQGPTGPTGVEGPQGLMGERGIGHSMLGPGCMCYLPMIAAAGATVYDKSEADYEMGLMNFDSGSVEPVLGEILTGVTSETTAIVVSVLKTGGTWGGGDASGSIVLEYCDGLFSDDENVNGSFGGANILTVNGESSTETKIKNDGTIHGAQWAFSEISEKCLLFGGENDYVQNPYLDVFDVGDFTISLWVKLNNVAVNNPLTSCRDTGGTDRAVETLVLPTGKPRFSFFGDDLVSDTVLSTATWYFLTFRFVRATKEQSIYINGVFDKSRISDGVPDVNDGADTGNGIQIGRLVTLYLDGLIDEVRIYARALTEAEIEVIYNQRYLTGVEGEQGPTGMTGVTGEQGLTGPSGPQGPSGIPGVQGPQGITGPSGPQGPSGIPGVQGPQGETGVTGDEGPQGPTGIPGGYCYSTVSDQLQNENNAEKSTTSASPVKLKETKLNEATGKMRIYFELYNGQEDPENVVYARIYKNGSPIGTMRNTLLGYDGFDENLGGFAVNDLLQIYAESEGGNTAYVRYFHFKYDRAITVVAGKTLVAPLVVIPTYDPFSVTNQDP